MTFFDRAAAAGFFALSIRFSLVPDIDISLGKLLNCNTGCGANRN